MQRSRLIAARPSASVAPHSGHGASFRRIVVPVAAFGRSADAVRAATRLCVAAGGLLRVVHVRVYDPPVRGCGRFYPETSAEATAVLENAVASAWAGGAKASGIVVEARRSMVAAAISAAASGWDAEVIVLARLPRPTISRLLLGSVADQVMRQASCPVLAVRPGWR